MITEMAGATNAQSLVAESGTGSELDKNAFLKLLIAQLRNQDPLKPMEDKEFIAQLAQFSSLEQMQLMNNTLAPFIEMMGPFVRNQTGFAAASWVGRTITAFDPSPPLDENGAEIDPQVDENGQTVRRVISGGVDSVKFTDDGPILTIRVTQKERSEDTGEYVEVERDKEIPLANVLSVS